MNYFKQKALTYKIKFSFTDINLNIYIHNNKP